MTPSDPTRRDALRWIAITASSPLWLQTLAACGSTTTEPGADDGTEVPVTPEPPKPLRVLFVPGFLSEVYTAVSRFEENSLNAALRAAARQYLNYNVYGPLGGLLYRVDVGDRIASLIDVDLIPDSALVSFATQMADLTATDVAFHDITEEPGFDSAESVAHNAAAIIDYLESVNDHDVVIVSHSKGGLDTLHALVTNQALVDDGPVVGWVALQAPFYGSPVASVAPSVADQLLIALGGGPALSDLSPGVREPYMSSNAAAVAHVASSIPLLSCSSTYDASSRPDWAAFALTVFNGSLVAQILDLIAANIAADPLHLVAALAKSATDAVALINAKIASTLNGALAGIGMMDTTNTLMNALGDANDGLVPRASAQLPGSTLVDMNAEVAPGDHAAPVMITAPLKQFWSTADRNALTRDLVDRASPAEA